MPKAGIYDFPFYDIDHVIEKLHGFHEILRTDEMEREIVAETLNMSFTGGGFANIVSSLEKYNLIDTGRGKITITELGKLVCYGTIEEKLEAKKKAILNITLFNEIYSTYGTVISEEHIRAFLRQKANVDITKVQKMAEHVCRIYNIISVYLTSTDSPGKISEKTDSELIDRIETPVPAIDESIKPLIIQHGQVYIRLPPDDLESLSLAKQAIEFMENIVKNKLKNK